MLYGQSPFIHENSKIMFRGILCEAPKFLDKPQISEEGKDFILSLLRKNPANRLGYEDEQEIFGHPWFSEVDFSVLLTKKVTFSKFPKKN